MTVTAAPPSHRLDDALLDGFRGRAGDDDRENRFFTADFEELREAGYLLANVPVELGGWGLDLAALGAEQRRLARYAPATALAMCMHLYWTGTAALVRSMGEPSLDWILHEAVAGEVFGSGHAESGNDVSLLFSTTRAVPVDGGYRLQGRKHFASLSPVWTRYGFHAVDDSDPSAPVIVHGFVERDEPNTTIVPVWDTLGMRATQSHDVVFDGAFAPADRVIAVAPVGDVTHPVIGAISANALLLIANVYVGIAERAFEVAVQSAQTKTSVAVPRGTMAHNPMVQHQAAEAYLGLEAATAVLERTADEFVAGVDHGTMWGAKIFTAKHLATTNARRVVDLSMEIVGGSGFFRGSEIERLYRDVRGGGYHPPTDAAAHEVIGKAALGVDDADGRW